MRYIICACLVWVIVGCGGSQSANQPDVAQLSWSQIEDLAKGTQVNMMMWVGDPLINAYMAQYVKPSLKQQYDIDLNIVGGHQNVLVSALMTELEAGKKESEIDAVWINGQNFFQLRQINALHGPFTDQLPNSQLIDYRNPFIKYDFQQEIDGYECPWGSVQMAMIYDSARTPHPPRTRAELTAWVKANPGRFTFDTDFTGSEFLKAQLIGFMGGQEAAKGPFKPAAYQAASQTLFSYVNEIKPYFWKQGETFPDGLSAVHQMFAAGEIDFTMSMNDNEVDNKIAQGVFPATARAYVWREGSIRNSHYLGIPRISPNKAGAMVLINFLISPEAQLKKQDPQVWGDGTVLNLEALPDSMAHAFQTLPNRKYAPPIDTLYQYAIMEPVSEYMIRIKDDFRSQVIKGNK